MWNEPASMPRPPSLLNKHFIFFSDLHYIHCMSRPSFPPALDQTNNWWTVKLWNFLLYGLNQYPLSYIGLWRWYINITITILHIIHRPVFYLQLNWTLWVCPYLTRNKLRLRYEPNRLKLSVDFWRWYINVTITILDIIHCPVFYLKLNSVGLSVPHRKQFTSPLRTQQVNRFVTMVGYINITITIQGIVHRPVIYLKQNVSERGFCLRQETETSSIGPINVPPEDGDRMQSPNRHVFK
jgi:hypothetical protein